MNRELKSGILFLLVAAILAIMNGLVFKTLWAWFPVKIFHLPAINLPEAVGLTVIVYFLKSSDPNPNYTPGYCLKLGALQCVTALSIGGIAYLFIM